MVDFSWASIGFHILDCECQSNLSTGGAWPHACGAQARGRRPRGAQLPPAVACRLQPVAWRRLQQASRGQRTCLVHVGQVGARGPGGCSQAQMPNQEADAEAVHMAQLGGALARPAGLQLGHVNHQQLPSGQFPDQLFHSLLVITPTLFRLRIPD